MTASLGPATGAGALARPTRGPRRIVCLTEETTELLYLLGEQDRIVGISAFAVRPPGVRARHPVVSGFLGGSVRKIEALKPDLVIGFSDIQANLAKSLIQANLPVLICNQRTIDEILETMVMIGSIVGRRAQVEELVDGYTRRLEALQAKSNALPRKPRVYFEEWDEPMISAIGWIGELIEIAGGIDVFRPRRPGRKASERVVTAEAVVAADPEVIFASWCGKPFDAPALRARTGFSRIAAVQSNQLVEVPPEIILQPGPAALTDGVDFLARALHHSATAV